MTTLFLAWALFAVTSEGSNVKTCRYGKDCTRPDCWFKHPRQPGGCTFGELCRRKWCEDDGRDPDCDDLGHEAAESIFQAPAQRSRGTQRQGYSQGSRKCRFGARCRRGDCTFEHPRRQKKACRYGMHCKYLSGGCDYKHPSHPLLDDHEPWSYGSGYIKTCRMGHPLQQYVVERHYAHSYVRCQNSDSRAHPECWERDDIRSHCWCLRMQQRRDKLEDPKPVPVGSLVYICHECQNNHEEGDYIKSQDGGSRWNDCPRLSQDDWSSGRFHYCQLCYDANLVPHLKRKEYEGESDDDDYDDEDDDDY